jgi:hypothetical protein
MSKESTIKRIEADIAAGDLGKARDRLNGLIRAYPEDIGLRSRLAEIYSKLQYPHMAGCYWYLEENQTDEMREAVAVFTKRCGNDPWVMWSWIKFRGNPDAVSPYVKQRLQELIKGCEKKHGRYPGYSGKKTRYAETTKHKWQNKIRAVGCWTVFVLILVFAFIGLLRIVFR